MVDLVIGAISGYNFGQVSCWVNSLNRCGFAGRKVMLIFSPALDCFERLPLRGFEVHSFPAPEHAIQVDRFRLQI